LCGRALAAARAGRHGPGGSTFSSQARERRSLVGRIEIDEERCKGCLFCIELCPKKSIHLSEQLNLKGYFVAAFDDDDGCNGCGICAVMCPEVAIEVEKA
jgi:2-oxoglutarate ferredoxin oxidoreductase subunit delta